PDRLVIPTDLILAWDVGKTPWRPRHDDPELRAELAKDLLQIDIVRPLVTERCRQLVSFPLGWRASLELQLGGNHAAASSESSASRSARFSENVPYGLTCM